jgi:hypothetical protein
MALQSQDHRSQGGLIKSSHFMRVIQSMETNPSADLLKIWNMGQGWF